MSFEFASPGTYNQSMAVQHLGMALRSSELALVLGSGIGPGLGLPAWPKLVNHCLAKVNLPALPPDATPESLTQAAGSVERAVAKYEDYVDIIREGLYEDLKTPESLLTHMTLISVGAMLLPGRRGSVTEVLSFNFDDVIEQYLTLHGFSWQSVFRLPTLRGGADVTIYHPHGFIPKDPALSRSTEVVFSKYSFASRLGEGIEPWTQMSKDLLLRKVGLFVGLSRQGPNVDPLLTSVHKGLAGTRPTAFWIVDKIDTTSRDEMLQMGVVPVVVGDYAKVPELFLEICRSAASVG